MATEDKKISFSATDAGLSAFMKKLQADGKSMYQSFAEEAKKQTSSQKEQFKIIQDQIKSLKEALKIQKEITQERIKQAKSVLENMPAHTAEGLMERTAAHSKLARANKDLQDVKDKERAVNNAQGQNVRPTNAPKESRSSILNDILKAGLFRDLFSLIRQVPNQENGLGLMSPALSVAGGALGAGMGAGIDAIAGAKILGTGFGDIHASTFMANLGKEAGGFFGDAITRSFRVRDQYDQSFNKFRAFGGKGGSENMSSMGFDDISVASTMAQFSKASGTAKGASGGTLAMLALSRAFGVDEGTSLSAFGMQRSGGGSGTTNMQRALGVAVAEGMDRAKFTDAIKTQTQLLQHFSESKNTVSSIDANRTMFEFNRMGGMFSLGDPRSIQNIMAVSGGLTNPNSGFGQAQNYAVLRGLFPNADPFDLKRKEEQGLQTPGFLKGVMDQIQSTGVSETLQKFMLKSRFGDLSFEGVDTLFKNKGQIGSMSESELSKMLGLKEARKEAEELTSRYTKMNAEVTNAFRDDFVKGISTLSDQFVVEMGRAIELVAAKMEAIGLEGSQITPVRGAKTPRKNGYTRMLAPDNLRKMGVDSVDVRVY